MLRFLIFRCCSICRKKKLFDYYNSEGRKKPSETRRESDSGGFFRFRITVERSDESMQKQVFYDSG